MSEQQLDYQGVLATLLGWIGDLVGVSVWEPHYLAGPTAFFVGALGSAHAVGASSDLSEELIQFEILNVDGAQHGGFFVPADALKTASCAARRSTSSSAICG